MGLVRCPRSAERCNTVTGRRDLTRDTYCRRRKKEEKIPKITCITFVMNLAVEAMHGLSAPSLKS